ncbi:MAG: helix-turn-helix domain-containing protein [Nitrososphaeria archaeon]
MLDTSSQNEEYLQLLSREGAIKILKQLNMGPCRFAKLKKFVRHTTLAKRLKELENAGLVRRRVTDSRPPTSVYEITEKGKEVLNILNQLRRTQQSP